MTNKRSVFLIIMSLIAVYSIWSSTYLAIKIMVQQAPALLSSGSRFFMAGLMLFIYQYFKDKKFPDSSVWWKTLLTGSLLMLGGTGFVCLAEQWVSSGLAAIAVSTVPLWTCLLSGMSGHWPNKVEWIGLTIGFTGIIILNLDRSLQANLPGAILLILAPMCWGLGSMLSKNLSLPPGIMTNSLQMLGGGATSMLVALLLGERFSSVPNMQFFLSWGYLIIFGSIIGFSAFMYLLHHVRPALATSYAFVNPVLAVILGVLLAGEHLSFQIVLAMGITLSGVFFVILGHK